MTDPSDTARTPDPGIALPAYRWLASLFVVLVLVQGYLGSNGAFNAEEWMITGHSHLGNSMFLLIIIQTVMSWLLFTRKAITVKEVGLNVLLVLLTVAQIGLGYSTRDGGTWATAVSLHIPNGVLLMGISSVVAVMAWGITLHRTSPSNVS